MKNTKLKIISAAVFLLAFNNSANAQWAVIDPANIAQSTITAAQTTLSAVYNYYTMLASGANGQGIQQTTQAVNLMQKQSVINLQTADMLERKAKGDAKMAEIGYRMLPSMTACIEASNNVAGSPRSAAGRASVAGAGGGSNGAVARAQAVTSTAAAQAEVLKAQTALGTCITELAGAAGCTSEGPYAGSDMHPRGIKGDTKDIKRNENAGAAFNNYTLDANGFEVAKKYAADMAYYDKPKVPTQQQLAKNPTYAAMYKAVQTKLDAANDTVLDIAKYKRASLTDISSTVPGKMWASISDAEYQKVTGLKSKPKNTPAMYDVVNFEVKNDYYGNPKAELGTTEELNKRLALSNYLNWTQYQQQETTNLLLSHILVQLTTPVNKATLDSEHTKTMNIK